MSINNSPLKQSSFFSVCLLVSVVRSISPANAAAPYIADFLYVRKGNVGVTDIQDRGKKVD